MANKKTMAATDPSKLVQGKDDILERSNPISEKEAKKHQGILVGLLKEDQSYLARVIMGYEKRMRGLVKLLPATIDIQKEIEERIAALELSKQSPSPKRRRATSRHV